MHVHDTSNHTENYWTQLEWTIPVTVNGVLIVIGSWIFFSIVHYGIKSRKRKNNSYIDVEKLNTGWIFSISVICAALTFSCLVTSQVYFHVGYAIDPYFCEVVHDILFVEYIHVLLFVFLFIWMRQRVFFVNEMLNVQFNKCLKSISSASLVIIFMSCYGVMLLGSIPDNAHSTFGGCHYTEENEITSVWKWSSAILLLVVIQVFLLAMLIYPLHKKLEEKSFIWNMLSCCYTKEDNKFVPNRVSSPTLHYSTEIKIDHSVLSSIGTTDLQTKTRKQVCNKSNDNKKSTQFELKPRSKRSTEMIKKIMKRTLILGMFAVLLEFAIFFVMLLPLFDHSHETLMRIVVLMYDFNVLSNLLFIIFSYLSYKEMLFSPFYKHRLGAEDIRASLSSLNT